MSVIRELQEQLQQTETTKFVTTMLRDISATRLQAIRAEFEANTAYYSELHQLMNLIKRYAAEAGVSLELGAGPRRVYVALTANRRFYGHLNTDVMKLLHERLATETDAAGYVIGQTGQQYVEADGAQWPVLPTVALFANDIPEPAEVRSVIAALRTYTEVMVIHPSYINSFRQEAVVTDITHQPALHSSHERPTVDYLFEPDLPALLHFFREQVRAVLFQRVLLETRLAFTGARLMKMQRARERAAELVRQERRTIHKQISTIQSMRLLETFTGFHSDRTL